jgi:hypothetical protein
MSYLIAVGRLCTLLRGAISGDGGLLSGEQRPPPQGATNWKEIEDDSGSDEQKSKAYGNEDQCQMST